MLLRKPLISNPVLLKSVLDTSQKTKRQVSFATTCWEKDWEILLKHPFYLKEKLIGNNCYPFSEKILIINNVKDPEKVAFFAKKKVDEKLLTNFYFAQDLAEEVLSFFGLKKATFKAQEAGVKDDWVYYNASGVLTALYICTGEFLLYHTGDAYLDQKVKWIDKALNLMKEHQDYKVANLAWNGSFQEAAKAAAFRKEKGFFVSESGFSDQQFLVKCQDFKKPIFNEIRSDSHHFPWGDTLEKRVFSFMKNHKWKRITYTKGSYSHQSF